MEKYSSLSEEEIFLFNQGSYFRAYEKLGAHQTFENGKEGYCFTVWAPSAKSVRVIGSFNDWSESENFMSPLASSGIWTLFITNVKAGELYKYLIETKNGEFLYKADPFAFESELRPNTASRTANLSGFNWRDGAWIKDREQNSHFEKPLNIYEAHLGSWKQHEKGEADKMTTPSERFYTYTELAETLVPFAKEMGYTHIELMPVAEHPFDGSWGYQITGYFASTSRYGTPQDFMYFIDSCHDAGLGVILDWVPGHFCRDAHGLGRFNGEKLYESEDHGQWGTYKFDLGRPEVRSFLISNALFWLDVYHIDGIRVDGVTSMLYLNFSIEDKSKHKKNRLGGEENLEAAEFLKEFNAAVGKYYKGVFTVAEESTAFPLVTHPPEKGGLGFHYKWDMGWMNDTLRYFSLGFEERPKNHRLLTFSMMYAFTENFILPLSHDEVVHGKHSLIGRMPGDYREQFSGMRLLMLYQMYHTGKKLSFMGNEIAQFIEWRYYEGIEWFLLNYETHRQFKLFIEMLNKLYLSEPVLWENDHDWSGFSWIDADNENQSIISFARQGKAEDDLLVIVLNSKPQEYSGFMLGVPSKGVYKEVFSSDEIRFGGSGKTNPKPITAKVQPMHGREYSIEISVPPLGGTILKLQATEKSPRED